jgi:protein-S-isoprenylcysteine O-methyltransferase Ste14
MPYQSIFLWEGSLKIVQMLLFSIAVFLLFAGAQEYNMLHFLGIQQIQKGTSHPRVTEDGQLAMTGVLGMSRHPWYVAAFVLIWARDLHVSTLFVNIILSIYLVIGTFLEERKLVLKYGDTYREYQRRVSMFLPYKWFKLKSEKFVVK